MCLFLLLVLCCYLFWIFVYAFKIGIVPSLQHFSRKCFRPYDHTVLATGDCGAGSTSTFLHCICDMTKILTRIYWLLLLHVVVSWPQSSYCDLHVSVINDTSLIQFFKGRNILIIAWILQEIYTGYYTSCSEHPPSCLTYSWSVCGQENDQMARGSLFTHHFSLIFSPNSLLRNVRHVNQSSGTEHSSPEEIICHQGIEELANPPFFSLLLLRTWGVACLLPCD